MLGLQKSKQHFFKKWKLLPLQSREPKVSWGLKRHCYHSCNSWWLHKIKMSLNSFLKQYLHCYSCYVQKPEAFSSTEVNCQKWLCSTLVFRVEMATIRFSTCVHKQSIIIFFSVESRFSPRILPSTRPWEAASEQQIAFKMWCICISNPKFTVQNFLIWGMSVQLWLSFYQNLASLLNSLRLNISLWLVLSA